MSCGNGPWDLVHYHGAKTRSDEEQSRGFQITGSPRVFTLPGDVRASFQGTSFQGTSKLPKGQLQGIRSAEMAGNRMREGVGLGTEGTDGWLSGGSDWMGGLIQPDLICRWLLGALTDQRARSGSLWDRWL